MLFRSMGRVSRRPTSHLSERGREGAGVRCLGHGLSWFCCNSDLGDEHEAVVDDKCFSTLSVVVCVCLLRVCVHTKCVDWNTESCTGPVRPCVPQDWRTENFITTIVLLYYYYYYYYYY